MGPIGYVLLGIAFLVLIIIAFNIKIVPQSRAYVIERLGAYSATWQTGLHFKIPIFERVAKIVSLKEQVVDFKPQPVITKDNVTMMIDTVLFYQIVDPKLYTYGIERPITAIENLSATTLRNIIGDLELDQTLTQESSPTPQFKSISSSALSLLHSPTIIIGIIIPIMEFIQPLKKKKEILPFATRWMDLEDIMQNEISQTEKDKYCMM